MISVVCHLQKISDTRIAYYHNEIFSHKAKNLQVKSKANVLHQSNSNKVLPVRKNSLMSITFVPQQQKYLWLEIAV